MSINERTSCFCKCEGHSYQFWLDRGKVEDERFGEAVVGFCSKVKSVNGTYVDEVLLKLYDSGHRPVLIMVRSAFQGQ